MDINELYHFLFETMPGMGILVGAGIVERKPRKQFKNHAKPEDDWSLFDDDDEEEN